MLGGVISALMVSPNRAIDAYRLASYPGLLSPAFLSCSANAGKGQVKPSCAMT